MNYYENTTTFAHQILTAGLQNTEWPVRFAAAEVWASLESNAGIPILEEAFESKDASIRERAITSLAKYKDPCFAPIFRRGLEDKDIAVRGYSLEALMQLGLETLDEIKNCLKDSNVFVQEKAVVALCHRKSEESIELLESIALGNGEHKLHHRNRMGACSFLAQIENPVGKKVLKEALETRDGWISFLAARKLAELGDSSGLSYLEHALEWGEWPEKIAAIESMILLGKKEDLVKKIHSPKEKPSLLIQLEAMRIFEQFSGEKTPEILMHAMYSEDEDVKTRAIELIGEIGRPELATFLGDVLQTGPQHLQVKAIFAIEELNDPELIEELAPLLENSHWLLQFQAARVIVKLSQAKREKVRILS